MGHLKKREADLDKPPKPLEINPEDTHVTLGDLHGNALKLIYTLIEEGVFEATDEQYNILKYIYKKNVEDLTAVDILTFKETLEDLKVNKERAITFIGDETADRGNNDYFTFLVFQKLDQNQVEFNIPFSNHAAEFFQDFQKRRFTGRSELHHGQARSLENMVTLIQRGIIDEDEVRTMVREHYLPHIQPIGYTLGLDGNIEIFTHAPVGLETIEELAISYGIPYKEDTVVELTTTIDQINAAIMKNEINTTQPQKRYHYLQYHDPLRRLVWARPKGDDAKFVKPRVKPKNNAYNVHFVHGHIGESKQEVSEHHTNTDEEFGKTNIARRTRQSVSHMTHQSNYLTPKQLGDNFYLYLWEIKVALHTLETEVKHHLSEEAQGKLLPILQTLDRDLQEFQGSSDPNHLEAGIALVESNRETITKMEGLDNNPKLKKAVGVVLGATVIFALLAHLFSNKGYVQTFFAETAEEKAGTKLKTIKEKLFDLRESAHDAEAKDFKDALAPDEDPDAEDEEDDESDGSLDMKM